MVGPNAILRGRGRSPKIYAALAAGMLLMLIGMVIGGVNGREVRADSQTQVSRQPVSRQPVSSDPLVIQGRITAIQGALVTVKLPDGYPGGPGIHAQVVTAGPTFKVDVSHARVLLPDGKEADTQPLAVGDRVLMVLRGPDSEGPGPLGKLANLDRTYFASTIERIVYNDKIVTH
jgi:hypothetical protein